MRFSKRLLQGIGGTFLLIVIICTFPLSNARAVSQGDGVFVYGLTSNTTPQYRSYYSNNTVDAETGTTSASLQPYLMALRSSPTKTEMVSGYADDSGNLEVMCYDGSTWSNEWSATVGGTNDTRRFDVAYEQNSGDALVLYAVNGSASMHYRTKSGSAGCGSGNWSSEQTVTPSQTTATARWIKLVRDGRTGSDVIAAAWEDDNKALSAMIWGGSSWANEPTSALSSALESVGAGPDVDSFDLGYESLSGDLMVVWGIPGASAFNLIKYATCTGGSASCTWTLDQTIPTVRDAATNIDLSADPTSDKMALSAIDDSSNDLSAAYWDGGSWTGYANLDGAVERPTAGMRLTQTGWLTNGSTTRWLLTYDDSTGTGLSWYLATPGSTPVKQSDVSISPSINDKRERYFVDNDPFNNDRLMLLVNDLTSQLIAFQATMDGSGAVTWANPNNPNALTTTLAALVPADYAFAYWRSVAPPGSLTVDIVDVSGQSVANPSALMSTVATGFVCGTSTGTLGISTEKIRVQNTTGSPTWNLSMAATAGATALWSSGTPKYDFNDPAGSPAGCAAGGDADAYAGQLSVDPTVATIAPEGGCSATGVSKGSASAYNEGVVNSITLASTTGSAQTGCYWDFTSISLSQKIPSEQPLGSYAINMTLTVVAT